MSRVGKKLASARKGKANIQGNLKPVVLADGPLRRLCFVEQDLPWIAHLIYRCRIDLQQKFDLNTEDGLQQYIVWLVRSASDTNRCLVEDPDFIAFCGKPMMRDSRLNTLEMVTYLSAPELQEKFLFPQDEIQYAAWFSSTFKQAGRGGMVDIARALFGLVPRPLPFAQQQAQLKAGQGSAPSLPFGVNIIGYAYGQLGIGEDARMTAKALQKLGIPFCLVNFKPGASIPQEDFSMQQYVLPEGPYNTNLFCMTATETARHFCFEGRKQWLGRHNIGYWPWELDQWPNNWLPVNDLVDEVWVATQHIRKALEPVFPPEKPLRVVPLHVELGPISPLNRSDFGLPEYAKLFCFSFDLHSSVFRKNPHDCIKVFLDSFPKEDERYTRETVGLVIKTHRPSRQHPEWDRLKQLAAEDNRIHIIEQTLSRPDLLALYNCCDCYISLHRAEGYGRGIAEAILLGLEVVTTNYSGNVDFCHPPQCQLVDCELIPVEAGQYIEGEGMMWAGNFKLPTLSVERQRFTNNAESQ